MIKKIIDGKEVYEVGKDGVVSISRTDHGNDKTKIYKVDYEDGTHLFYGTQAKHELEESE